MKGLGILITVIAGAIIGYNIYMSNECTKIANDHPIITLTTSGQNLPNNGHYYTFYPPSTPFEIGVYIALGVGILFICFGKNGNDSSGKETQAKDNNTD